MVTVSFARIALRTAARLPTPLLGTRQRDATRHRAATRAAAARRRDDRFATSANTRCATARIASLGRAMLSAVTTTFVAGSLLAGPLAAGERYATIALSELKLEPGVELLEVRAVRDSGSSLGTDNVEPYVVVPGATAYPHYDQDWTWFAPGRVTSISMRVPDGVEWKGWLHVPDPTTGAIRSYAFEVAPPADSANARTLFLQDELSWSERQLSRGWPGAAWFRHVSSAARRELGQSAPTNEALGWARADVDPLDLFSGSQAVAENLNLDRTLRVPAAGEESIAIDSITGVTTRAMDWKALVAGKKPELDPLARFVPADQHAAFFPSFAAMTAVVDELDQRGTQLFEFFGASAEDHGVRLRYQEQLCLPFSTLGRLLGPAVVSSVAVTGSDPFLVGGSDVVVIFECKEPGLLEGFVGARMSEAEKKGARRVDGEVLGTKYSGVANADRSISAYLARFDDVVVVTNSFLALTKVARLSRDTTQSILSADEYVWFRDRYRRGDASESAFLVLTDATIRRWAGPRSRIGDARRLHAAAAMAEIQARHMDDLVAGRVEVGSSAAAADLPVSADFTWTKDGVRSPTYGTAKSLTPILEMNIDRVSAEEKAAYEAFRTSFQQRWRLFDPIAVRLGVDANRVTADVTIQPLTLDTEYADLRKWTEGAELGARSGDPHAGTLFHVATALSRSNELGQLLGDLSGVGDSRFGPDPFAWMGSTFAIFGEKDPWWDDLRESRGDAAFDDADWYSIPVAVRIDVKDPLKLAAFLTALRAFVDESAPNLTKWENRTWQDTGYVRIAPVEGVLPVDGGAQPALYYVPLPDALVLSLREDLVKKAIERRVAAQADPAVRDSAAPWLGSHAALRFDVDALDVMSGWVDRREAAAWSALPILDVWKRRYPNEDPVALHERIFGVRLAPPDGGRYVWNEERRRMEASNYVAPGARPKERVGGRLRGLANAELGLTFEGEGLRARIALERAR